ncbi:MAG: phosphatidate cytidylyltransferase [Phycisphaerae bacterium]|nr:phosphatidate cytidylyltransferase [Phycisphaerae bacterium]
MKTRILLGTIMIAAVAALLWADWYLEEAGVIRLGLPHGSTMILRGLPVAVTILALSVLAIWEMVRLCGAAGVLILGLSAAIGSTTLGTLPLWWQFVGVPLSGQAVMVLLAVVVALTFLEQMIRSRTTDALRTIACTLLTVLYLGVGGAMILQIRMLTPNGLMWLVLFLAVVKSTDIGAYFVGSAVGLHKMIPWLSPGKSWEGLFGGLAAGTAVSLLGNWGMGAGLIMWQAALFGVVVGLVGQFGDLCESLLKRSVHVKDSGATVPEFGGMLDIIDSPLMAAAPAYLLLAVM